ncbi:MAG TPA: cytochrome c [Nannocystis sp.]
MTLNIIFSTRFCGAPVRPARARFCASAVLAAALFALSQSACEPAPPQFTEPQVLGGVTVSAETLNHGQKLFNRYCASCHGYDGGGQGPAARNLDARDFRTGRFIYKSTPGDTLPTDADLMATIKHGKPDKGMPAWGGFRDEDLRAMVSYIKTFSPRWREPATPPADPPAAP